MELPGGAGLALGNGSWVVEGRKIKLKPSDMGTIPGLEPDTEYRGASKLWEESGHGIVM